MTLENELAQARLELDGAKLRIASLESHIAALRRALSPFAALAHIPGIKQRRFETVLVAVADLQYADDALTATAPKEGA